MAKIFPSVEKNFNNSYGEMQIFEALKSLPDDWYVFHSIKWSEKRRAGYVTWGEADFVIFNRQYGILVIEVKSGDIFCRNGEFVQKRLDNGEEFKIQPFEQADRSKYKIIAELRKNDIATNCFVDKAVWFPSTNTNFDEVPLPMEYKKELILDAKDLNSPLESIKNIFEFYNAGRFTDLYDSDVDKIFQILIPSFDLVPEFGNVRNEVNYSLNQLTNEQKKILDYIDDEDEMVAIAGAAGTGKTFIALERARRLAENNKKVLFLCFNRQLRDYLDQNNRENNVSFLNIHQFLYRHGMLSSLDENESILSGDFSLKEDGYDYCIIDEAQDFDDEVLRKVVEKVKEEKIGLTLFYDKNQLIIKNKLSSIINDFECKMTLKNNCRNTIKIMETLSSSINVDPRPSHLSVAGEMPVLKYSLDTENVKRSIENQILEYMREGFSMSNITILTMSTTEYSSLSGVQKLGDFNLSDSRQNDVIFFTSVRKFKGLESDCVIIVDFDVEKIYDEEYSRIFYVASSRARQKLAIFTPCGIDKLKNVGSQIEGSFNPILKISNKIKVKIEEAK